MDTRRFDAEIAVLDRYLPRNSKGDRTYAFNEKHKDYLFIITRSRSGNNYMVYFELKSFPARMPKVFVSYPVIGQDGKPALEPLRDKGGNDIPAPSHEWHTLSKSKEYGTQICHSGKWDPNTSIYFVFEKIVPWIEAYEKAIVTGKTVSTFLPG